MSNYLAIATVTETLRQRVESAASAAVPGAVAVAERPEVSTTPITSPTIRVFMYQVTPNPAWRNEDLPNRRSDGLLTRRPQGAFDLYYLLSFYGTETTHEPQRMLGRVTSLLTGQPVLTRQMIEDAKNAASVTPTLAFLSASDLGDQPELVRFTPIALNLEELSKLWSVFFQIPYTLSIAYMGTVVLIEGDETPRTALPVLDRTLSVFPFHTPVIESLDPDRIEPGSVFSIRGRNLIGQVTYVRIDDNLFTPDSASASALTLTLPADLSAGMHGVQVVHEIEIGVPPVPHEGVESNIAPLILQPTIETPMPVSVSAGGILSLEVAPPVHRSQRLALLVGEQEIPIPPRAESDPETATIFDFKFGPTIAPGTYRLRLRVDGAVSSLKFDGSDPEVSVA